jgi:HK97 family phage portal protein
MWPFSSTAVTVATATASPAVERMQERAAEVIAPGAGAVLGIEILPPHRDEGPTSVSVDAALSLATAYRCVSLLAELVSGLRLYAERGGRPMRSVPPLLRKPSLDEPLRDTLALTVSSLACTGNAYWLLVRPGPREPVSSLKVLDPATVTVERDPQTGEPVYQRTLYNGCRVAFPAWQRSHLRLLRVPGKLLGLGPVQAGQAELRGAIDLRNYGARWFRDSTAAPKDAWLSTDQSLTRSEVEAYREQLEKLKIDGRIPVFGSGVKLNYSRLSPQEALWIEAQSHYSATVARLFGVPATLVDERSGGSETYANQQDKRTALLSQTLSAYTSEVESALSALLAPGTTAKFDTSTLFAADQGSATAADNAVVTTTDTATAPVDQAGGPDV